MRFKYSLKKLENYNANYQIGKKFASLVLDKSCKKIEFGEYVIFIEGEFYYSKASALNYQSINHKNLDNIIVQLVRKKGIINLPKYLEGAYLCCWFNKKKNEIGIFSDDLSRTKSYYVNINQDEFELSTQIKDLINYSDGYDQLSLYSYILLGYTGEKDTFYSKIKRLSSDEYFLFTKNSIHKKKNYRIAKNY